MVSLSSSPTQDDSNCFLQPTPAPETAVRPFIIEDALLACQIQRWYPRFLQLTFRTEFVALAETVLRKHVLAGGNLTRRGPEQVATSPTERLQRVNSFNSGWSSDSGGWDYGGGAGESESDGDTQPGDNSRNSDSVWISEEDQLVIENCYREIRAKIWELGSRGRAPPSSGNNNGAISISDRGVFAKLNWSSPQDAVWISPGRTLSCTTPEEIFTLLSASDYISHDLCDSFDDVVVGSENSDSSDHIANLNDTSAKIDPIRRVPFHLALRRWEVDCRSCLEFRVFIHKGRVVGISQRDVTACYSFLATGSEGAAWRAGVEERIRGFLADNRIVDEFGLEDFVVDLYLKPRAADDIEFFGEDLGEAKSDVKMSTGNKSASNSMPTLLDRCTPVIVDFSPLGGATDPLLFRWGEILNSDGQQHSGSDTLIRVVGTERDALPNPNRYNGLPLDLWNFGQNPAEMLRVIQKVERDREKSQKNSEMEVESEENG